MNETVAKVPDVVGPTDPNHQKYGTPKSVAFSVDSALLRELGERLVGKPHTALAELVKNSYDADATEVVIRVGENAIEIIDNGRGMNGDEFARFWMRIGTPHKQRQKVSARFGRPLTGSKGVGRLAVQFLAHRLDMYTVSIDSLSEELIAQVNWDQAVKAGELTQAHAFTWTIPSATVFPSESKVGTRLVLAGLKQEWNTKDFVALAREIWALQPPFRAEQVGEKELARTFSVKLESSDEGLMQSFSKQSQAFLDLYYARIVGKLFEHGEGEQRRRTVRLSVAFQDGEELQHEYNLIDDCANCVFNELEFEIRVYYVDGRQKFGIKVDDVRNYLKDFGGVHIYDAGFHLPYYGADTDWLKIEYDHAHRMFKSVLVPEELRPKDSQGLRYLPTNGRLFGIVHVNTARERATAEQRKIEDSGDYLDISVTRDRLIDNKAFQCLEKTVRYAVDFYAFQEARRKAVEKARSTEIDLGGPDEAVPVRFQRVEDVLQEYRASIPSDVYSELQQRLQEAVAARSKEAEAVAGHVGLLGALATAGISSLAYEHEVNKQFHLLASIASQLEEFSTGSDDIDAELNNLSLELNECLDRMRATRSLFSHLINTENREIRQRFKARPLIRRIIDQMGILIRDVVVETNEIEPELLLPIASYAEWCAIFQNVILNAVNAMLDTANRNVAISSLTDGKARYIFLQDTGSGVDLKSSEDLFKPFVRKSYISAERQALGLGGTGLGLPIVRMIATSVGCKTSFIMPSAGFNTSFEISWRETE